MAAASTSARSSTGKIADLIVLSGDPLANIAHTRMIDAVVFRGETLTRAHLNQLLSQAGLQPAAL